MLIETRKLFTVPSDQEGTTYKLRVQVEMFDDPDSNPKDDGDWATPEDLTLWRDGKWQYVGMVASIHVYGQEIGEDSLWAMVHGDIATCSVDAWELGDTSLTGIIKDAVDDARAFLEMVKGDVSILAPIETWIKGV